MPSHYTAPEMFQDLLAPSVNKERIHISYQYKATEKQVSGWRHGIFCPTKKQQSMGVKKGTTTGGTIALSVRSSVTSSSLVHEAADPGLKGIDTQVEPI